MSTLDDQVENLDTGLFAFLPTTTSERDRRALLALHTAAAEICGQFTYLEIGSEFGGSLQAVMRDLRCRSVISIDLRPATAPDARGGTWDYGHDNTTDRMLELLGELQGVDMGKLTTFDAGTDTLHTADLPVKPDYCFIDGEHTHDAVLRDARFCAEALGGAGVLAFHDYFLVGSAISAFARENWREISYAVTFSNPSDPSAGLGVLALELGDRGLLRHPAINRAMRSRWHALAWKAANRSRRSAFPFLMVCATMPAVDSFVALARHGLREYISRSDEEAAREGS